MKQRDHRIVSAFVDLHLRWRSDRPRDLEALLGAQRTATLHALRGGLDRGDVGSEACGGAGEHAVAGGRHGHAHVRLHIARLQQDSGHRLQPRAQTIGVAFSPAGERRGRARLAVGLRDRRVLAGQAGLQQAAEPRAEQPPARELMGLVHGR